MNSPTRPVLITGCSSGIGRVTAARLARAGFLVYASARNLADLDELGAAGCRTIALDVTDEASRAGAVQAIERDAGPLFALVNNAGYSQSGALESLSLEKMRAQFETNVFGLLRLTQLVLPGMRRAGGGRVVNLSSMGGKFTFPGGGIYHASKFALEALSDVLRFEAAPSGVDVVIIEPGAIKTQFAEAVARHMPVAATADDPFAKYNAAMTAATRNAYEHGPLALLGGGPEKVARVIERALLARRPRTRYKVTASAYMMIAMHAILPDRLWDAFMRTQYGDIVKTLPKAGA